MASASTNQSKYRAERSDWMGRQMPVTDCLQKSLKDVKGLRGAGTEKIDGFRIELTNLAETGLPIINVQCLRSVLNEANTKQAPAHILPCGILKDNLPSRPCALLPQVVLVRLEEDKGL